MNYNIYHWKMFVTFVSLHMWYVFVHFVCFILHYFCRISIYISATFMAVVTYLLCTSCVLVCVHISCLPSFAKHLSWTATHSDGRKAFPSFMTAMIWCNRMPPNFDIIEKCLAMPQDLSTVPFWGDKDRRQRILQLYRPGPRRHLSNGIQD